mmetsp:Transcript_29390/g.68707  ORF Transcript_29390/g.68707 Transcript_29390/m.68707 type:complete len:226 (-) Transcript_29390:115-792(-)
MHPASCRQCQRSLAAAAPARSEQALLCHRLSRRPPSPFGEMAPRERANRQPQRRSQRHTRTLRMPKRATVPRSAGPAPQRSAAETCLDLWPRASLPRAERGGAAQPALSQRRAVPAQSSSLRGPPLLSFDRRRRARHKPLLCRAALSAAAMGQARARQCPTQPCAVAAAAQRRWSRSSCAAKRAAGRARRTASLRASASRAAALAAGSLSPRQPPPAFASPRTRL